MPEKESLLAFTPLTNRQLESVIAIEETGMPPYWDKSQFIQATRSNDNHCYVLEHGDPPKVIGFVALEHKDHHVSLLNIGVHKDFRRKGYGRLLINGTRARFPNCALHTIINEACLDVQLFLKHTGWICESIVKSDVNVYLFILPVDSIG